MKTTIFTFCLILLSSCGNKEENKEQSLQFKVAAYNVEYSKNASAQEIGEALKPYNFDIVCFSEAPAGGWTKEVAEVLSMDHVVVGQYSTAGHVDKYKTIASQTPLYGYEEILMADTLHTVTRAVTKIDNKEIVIYSVHFPFGWRNQAHIDETTGKISAFVNYLKDRPDDETAVIMGDFNFIPSSSEDTSMYYEMFVDIGFDVSWKDLGIDVTQQKTSNAFDSEDEDNGRVIDHIMYNPNKVKALDGGIIEMETPLSDHKPVWTLLQLK